ncbi:DUF952 domain-containing protein [Telmatospirillum sp.]|uniref:DUF952 domain-containing protein n=1 Tax=Telmatospirillum sp. TaxID=2079197 RepID=UPI002848E649|nr:DUF952 domain-containing protein [Telmatospirillum sp.]MDR3440756.1 DUF952 domain-containing protein [Telmatospirillum sp.]
MSKIIYHMCHLSEWQVAVAADVYGGASQDQADGFIHFSTGSQVEESARRHRAGQDGLVLLTVDAAMLGDSLRWEEARGGELFPHLYGKLPISAVMEVQTLPLDESGEHRFPLLED